MQMYFLNGVYSLLVRMFCKFSFKWFNIAQQNRKCTCFANQCVDHAQFVHLWIYIFAFYYFHFKILLNKKLSLLFYV